MKTYKIGIVGYFATGKSKAGGQEAKTCSLDEALKTKYGVDNLFEVDTTDWKRRPVHLFLELFKLCLFCENIIMLPAQNSIKVFIPLLQLFNIFFHRKLLYSVVGGWLPDFLDNNKKLLKSAIKLDCIFVETKSMKEKLESIGCDNIEVVPNFKKLKPISKNELNQLYKIPYSLCTFSRVMKEKGIEDIITSVVNINKKYKKEVLRLDIYGKIDEGYQKKFENMIEKFPEYIIYKGKVEPYESVGIIKDYFALVFPTRYYTEGVPGTLIDAYMAGVPVITSLWGNYEDVFIEGVTGWGYEFGNTKELEYLLEKIIKNPDEFIKMKSTALENSKKYTPELAITKICEKLD